MSKRKGSQKFEAKLDEGLRRVSSKVSQLVSQAFGGVTIEVKKADKKAAEEKGSPLSNENPDNKGPAGRASLDSSEASAGREGSKAKTVLLDGGDIVLLILGILLMPIWIVIGFFYALGPLGYAMTRLVTALSASFYAVSTAMGGNDKETKKTKKMWAEVGREWRVVGRRMYVSVAAFSKPFGLSKIFTLAGQRYTEMKGRYDNYVTAPADEAHTPESFRERYHVVDQLPSGGSSARVYVVRKVGAAQEDLRVLKYFDLTTGSHLESLVREENAVKLSRRLNLISDSNLDERSFWYVMPYYRGATMTRAVLDHSSKDKEIEGYEERSLGWTHQLLQVLSQYHDAGILHKDIKPDNLIVNGEHIYLVDIGLLTDLSSDQQLTTHGTEYFRDPEMVKLALKGEKVRDVSAQKFDLYSIGAVLFFLFEGEFPTNGPLSRMGRGAPRAVRMIAQKAMGPFEKRYSDARQMLADVDYLCWASAQGELSKVRPTDLPSFRNGGSEVSEDEIMSVEQDDKMPAAYYPPAYAQGDKHASQAKSEKGEVIAWVVMLICGTIIAVVALLADAGFFSSSSQSGSPSDQASKAATIVNENEPGVPSMAVVERMREGQERHGFFILDRDLQKLDGLQSEAFATIVQDQSELVRLLSASKVFPKGIKPHFAVRVAPDAGPTGKDLANKISASMQVANAFDHYKLSGPESPLGFDSSGALELERARVDRERATFAMLKLMENSLVAAGDRAGEVVLPIYYIVGKHGDVTVLYPGVRLDYDIPLNDD